MIIFYLRIHFSKNHFSGKLYTIHHGKRMDQIGYNPEFPLPCFQMGHNLIFLEGFDYHFLT